MLEAYKELAPVLYGENGLKLCNFSFCANDMCFHAHWHERIELLQILSGSLEIYLDNEPLTALQGQVVVILPSMIHCGFSGESGVSYNMIAIDIEKLSNATVASNKYISSILNRTVTFDSLVEHPTVLSSINELVNSLEADSTQHPLYATSKTYEVISFLYRYCNPASRQSKKPDTRFGMVLEYINNHYTEDISARDISQQFGYDETYFCRRFKEATGITTMKYIRILRLELAQELLRQSNESITHISWKCGYADTHYFANCFKRHFGITPTEFRQRNKMVI